LSKDGKQSYDSSHAVAQCGAMNELTDHLNTATANRQYNKRFALENREFNLPHKRKKELKTF